MKRILVAPLALGAALVGAACARGHEGEPPPGTTPLSEVLRPAFFADALGRAGGAHFHGTTRFAVGQGAPDEGVTTTTDVWVDGVRNFRIVELNDRDGGREVVRVGPDLFVALRYGKMIHRVAEEPEPTHILADALGGPWAAWEIAAPWAAVARTDAGAKVTEYAVTRATARTEDPPTAQTSLGVRAWRAAAVVSELAAHAVVDDAAGVGVHVVERFDLAAKFTTTRDGHDLAGAIDVHGAVTDVGRVAPIARPASEELAFRQRIVPEQRELLAGLPATHPLPMQPPKAGAKAITAPLKPGGATLAPAPAPTLAPGAPAKPPLKGH